MNAPFDTTVGMKQKCREDLVKAIKRYCPKGPNKDFLVLPSREAHDAYLLQKHWPKSIITGLEHDPSIFAYAKAKHRSFKIEHESVAGFVIQERNDQFDAAYLDYMGVADIHRCREIAMFVERYAKDQFVLGLTFCMNARVKIEEVGKLIRDYVALTEEEEKAATFDKVWVNGLVPSHAVKNVVWNTAANHSQLICGYIDAHTSGLLCHVINSYSYQARKKSSQMHFCLLYIERV